MNATYFVFCNFIFIHFNKNNNELKFLDNNSDPNKRDRAIEKVEKKIHKTLCNGKMKEKKKKKFYTTGNK